MARLPVWCAAAVLVVGLAAHAPAAGESLTDHTGRPITGEDFPGKALLVFFGYTQCPDVCPTDLQIIGDTMEELGRRSETIQPVFITVDPERDTRAVLADYVRHFHPRLVGVTGPRRRIRQIANAYLARFSRFYTLDPDAVPGAPPRYTVDHTAYTYLLKPGGLTEPDGRFLAVFPHGTSPEAMAAGIREHLGEAVGRTVTLNNEKPDDH